MEIGDRISMYRKRKELTKRKLAKEANVSDSYLSQVEKGEKNPSVSFLNAIANALGVSLFHLLIDESDLDAYTNLPPHLREFIASEKARPIIDIAYFIYNNQIPLALVTKAIASDLLSIYLYNQHRDSFDTSKHENWLKEWINFYDGFNEGMFGKELFKYGS